MKELVTSSTTILYMVESIMLLSPPQHAATPSDEKPNRQI